MTRISGLESNLYGNRSDVMATNSRIYDDKNLTYTTCRECLAEINITNYSPMCDYSKQGTYSSWAGPAGGRGGSGPDGDTCGAPTRVRTCASPACVHQGDASGIVLHEILSKISEEEENAENARMTSHCAGGAAAAAAAAVGAVDETELSAADKAHCDETHYLLSGNLASSDAAHRPINSLPIDVLCKT